jgi:hypothetical protein
MKRPFLKQKHGGSKLQPYARNVYKVFIKYQQNQVDRTSTHFLCIIIFCKSYYFLLTLKYHGVCLGMNLALSG